MLVVGPLALLLAAFAGYRLAGAALRPVESMRREAAEISSETSGRRLPVPEARDEVRRLGETLNEMLERLDEGLLRERRFVADAGHELRTPLALLRTELELALRRPRTPEELEAAIRSATEEVERLIRLAEALLVLDRSARRRALQLGGSSTREELLDAVAREVRGVARTPSRPRDRGGRRGRRGFRGDRDRLEQALGSLVDNALTHGEGTVRLEAERADGRARRSASATTAPASRPTSCRTPSSASAARTRRGRAAAPASGSRSSTPSPALTAAAPPPPVRP